MVDEDGTPEARYSNYFQTGYNAYEFEVAFGQFNVNGVGPLWHTRIVTSPEYARELLELLRESIAQRDLKYGVTGQRDE